MFATIYLPKFFLQAAVRHQEISSSTPIGLIDETDKKPTIIQLNSAAEATGVHIGMAPSQGLARCVNLLIKTRCLANEAALSNVVLHYCFSLSPYVEATAAGVWSVQFTRADNVYEKVSNVIQQLTECDIAAHAGIAPTPDLSFLAVNLTRPVLHVDNVDQFLGPLSIDILAVPLQQ